MHTKFHENLSVKFDVFGMECARLYARGYDDTVALLVDKESRL
jgi:hypothetical protein